MLRGADGGAAPLRLCLTAPEFHHWLSGGAAGGDAAHWRPEAIAAALVCKHGYDARSPHVQMLVRVMAGFAPAERRAFLLFVTGAPRLPPGGFAGLSPRLTVVRKEVQGGRAADRYLPSCRSVSQCGLV